MSTNRSVHIKDISWTNVGDKLYPLNHQTGFKMPINIPNQSAKQYSTAKCIY